MQAIDQRRKQTMHSSTKWIIGEVAVIVALFILFSVMGYPPFLPYQWHKFLHIMGAILFVGNIVVTAVWMTLAAQSQEQRTLHFAARTVNWADVFFTAPGIFLILLNGQIMATASWGGLTASWIVAAYGLFILSGLIWFGFLLRLQNRLVALSAEPATSESALPAAFFHALRQWFAWGTVAVLLPLLSLVLMVLKPQLW